MDVCIACADAWVDGPMDGRMHAWTHVWVDQGDGSTHVCVNGCVGAMVDGCRCGERGHELMGGWMRRYMDGWRTVWMDGLRHCYTDSRTRDLGCAIHV